MKAVIFDWGGVLMRTADQGFRHAWDRRLGLTPGSVERVVHGIPAWQEAQLGQRDLESYWQAVGDALGLSGAQIAALRSDFYRGDRLDQDLISLIRDLKSRAVQVGLMSNNTPDLRDTLTELGLNRLFDACVISAEIGVMKPDPGAYRAILQALQAAPDRAVFIDDFLQNVEGASNLGIKGIRFTPGMDLSALLEEWITT